MADLSPVNPYDEMWASQTDLLLPAAPRDYDKFARAASVAFEAPGRVIRDLSNYDLLWRPGGQLPGCLRPNYYQLFSLDTSEREPIESVLSYLADARDPCYHEPYDRTDEEEARVVAWRSQLRARHPTAGDYLASVSRRLFLGEDRNLSDYEGRLRRAVWKAA